MGRAIYDLPLRNYSFAKPPAVKERVGFSALGVGDAIKICCGELVMESYHVQGVKTGGGA
ncbi:MAG: hypothetical protein HPY68_07365 [Candidatus Atribacteria bacterium]|nr:hypothetical protein [Candidatus Atribacteria bacterium]